MLDNPAGQWGEVEVPLNDICRGDFREDNGVLQKAYRNCQISDRARFGGEGHLRGETRIIVKRGPAERQAPPGYSGSGNVSIQLLNGYRYWRFDGNGSPVEHTGGVSCNPDEAVQIVSTGAASYV
jgi:hypothetical protein